MRRETNKGWDIVHKTLKVCWENNSSDLNCGTCEKCVRTQAAISAAGNNLEQFEVFPNMPLAQSIRKLSYVQPSLIGQWRMIAQHTTHKTDRRAINVLITRSSLIAHLILRLLRRMVRKYTKLPV